MSKKRLRHFTSEERQYVLMCLAEGKTIPQTRDYFLYRFFDFGSSVALDSLKKILYERIRNIKRNHIEDIQAMANLINVDLTSDLVNSLYKGVYKIWLQVPDKTLKDVRVDSTGVGRCIYKFHTYLQMLIFKEMRKITRLHPGALIANQIPVADPIYRLHYLDRLLSEIPIRTFLRYSRKEGRDIYTSHVRKLLRVLKEASIEMKALPIAAQFPFPQSDGGREKIRQLYGDFFNDPC